MCGGKVCGLGEGSEMQYPATGSNSGVVLKLDAEPTLQPRSQTTVSVGDTLVDPEVEQTGVRETTRRDRCTRLFEQLSLELDHLSPAEEEQLKELIQKYSDVFALDASELGTTTLVQHVITTGEHTPVRQPARRMPFSLQSDVDRMVGEMLAQGVIEPSSSPWASPVVLVKKKDRGVRFCVNYRRLNHVTKLDEFPLPRIDDTMDLLAGARYFTTPDLTSGYCHGPFLAGEKLPLLPTPGYTNSARCHSGW